MCLIARECSPVCGVSNSQTWSVCIIIIFFFLAEPLTVVYVCLFKPVQEAVQVLQYTCEIAHTLTVCASI